MSIVPFYSRVLAFSRISQNILCYTLDAMTGMMQCTLLHKTSFFLFSELSTPDLKTLIVCLTLFDLSNFSALRRALKLVRLARWLRIHRILSTGPFVQMKIAENRMGIINGVCAGWSASLFIFHIQRRLRNCARQN